MRTLLFAACLLLAACVSPNPEPATPDGELALEPVVEEPPAPPPWEGAHTVASTTGRWRVRWMSEPSPIPENEPFTLSVWVLDIDDEPAAVELAVDAGMPQHGHGMNRVPRVVANDSKGFEADGLLFHMPGSWELYFDISHGALTERAQVEVVLE